MEAFIDKYLDLPNGVIADYGRRLNENSYRGKGYRVEFIRDGKRSGQYWIIRPECREKCIPTQKTIDAFAIQGMTISFSNTLEE